MNKSEVKFTPIDEVEEVESTTSQIIPEDYTFRCSHGPAGFNLEFKRDGEGLCATMFELGRGLNTSLGDKAFKSAGDLFRTFAEMCDEIDKLEKENANNTSGE